MILEVKEIEKFKSEYLKNTREFKKIKKQFKGKGKEKGNDEELFKETLIIDELLESD